MAKSFSARPPIGRFSTSGASPIYGEVEPTRAREGATSVDPSIERLSHWMDSAFEIPGLKWRFGLDAILGLIPGLGDTLTSLISVYVLTSAAKHGVPKITLARMGLNLCIDYVIGAIPFIGDVFDVWFKANNRNMALLRRAVAASPPDQRRMNRGDWLFVIGVIAAVLTVLIAAVAAAIYIAALVLGGIANLL